MDLFFSPLACSLSSRITVYEAGAEGEVALRAVDVRAGKTADGADYLAINPLGLVPALRLDDGQILTENAAILPYLADQFPQAELAPKAGGLDRARLTQWLGFIGTELHKGVFNTLLSREAPAEAKAYALKGADKRLAHLNRYLTGREFMLDRFSVVDAYLTTILNWAQFVKLDLGAYPAVADYFKRMTARPQVARAMSEEFGLYQAA